MGRNSDAGSPRQPREPPIFGAETSPGCGPFGSQTNRPENPTKRLPCGRWSGIFSQTTVRHLGRFRRRRTRVSQRNGSHGRRGATSDNGIECLSSHGPEGAMTDGSGSFSVWRVESFAERAGGCDMSGSGSEGEGGTVEGGGDCSADSGASRREEARSHARFHRPSASIGSRRRLPERLRAAGEVRQASCPAGRAFGAGPGGCGDLGGGRRAPAFGTGRAIVQGARARHLRAERSGGGVRGPGIGRVGFGADLGLGQGARACLGRRSVDRRAVGCGPSIVGAGVGAGSSGIGVVVRRGPLERRVEGWNQAGIRGAGVVRRGDGGIDR